VTDAPLKLRYFGAWGKPSPCARWARIAPIAERIAREPLTVLTVLVNDGGLRVQEWRRVK